jgi:hypothetical protein
MTGLQTGNPPGCSFPHSNVATVLERLDEPRNIVSRSRHIEVAEDQDASVASQPRGRRKQRSILVETYPTTFAVVGSPDSRIRRATPGVPPLRSP